MSDLGNLDANNVGRYDDPHGTVGLSFAQLLNLGLKSVSDALTTLKNLIKAGDTGWINLALTGGATGAGGDLPAYRVLNGVTYIRGVFASTGTGGSVKATLPVGARPSRDMVLLIRQGVNSTRVSINTAGEISTLNSLADVYLTGITPFPKA